MRVLSHYFLASLLAFFACSKVQASPVQAQEILIDAVLASVDGKPITLQDVEKKLSVKRDLTMKDLMVDEEGNLEIDDDDQLEGKGAGGEEDGWDVGDDLALPADIDVGKIGGDETDFTVPTHGQPPSTHWTNNSRLVFDQVAAGDFDSAARLLLDQLGVRNLEPFKHLFLTTHGKI